VRKRFCDRLNSRNADQLFQTRSYCGTPEYMAPEIILDTGHNFAVDWCVAPCPSLCAFASLAFPANTHRRRRWCLGILLYEMHVGKTPFVHKDRKQMYHSIIKKDPEYPASFPPLAKDLCNKLLWSAFHFPPCACRTHAVCSDVTRHAAKHIKVAWGQGVEAGGTCSRIPTSGGLTGKCCCEGTWPWTKTGFRSLTSAMACRLFIVCLFVCLRRVARRHTQAISCDFRHTALCF
jgi:hypothetical protein